MIGCRNPIQQPFSSIHYAMNELDVIKNPNSILRKVSEPISEADLLSAKTQSLIDNMIETMKVENGVGLAAPQVGEHLRIIIAETNEGPRAFINPKIISKSEKIVSGEEGCLSVPGVYGIVKRHKKVKIKAKNRQGEPVRMSAGGLLSVIFQHEIDHLDGILFIDKAEKIIKGESASAI